MAAHVQMQVTLAKGEAERLGLPADAVEATSGRNSHPDLDLQSRKHNCFWGCSYRSWGMVLCTFGVLGGSKYLIFEVSGSPYLPWSLGIRSLRYWVLGPSGLGEGRILFLRGLEGSRIEVLPLELQYVVKSFSCKHPARRGP